MTAQEIRACVAEYRRLSGLVRQIRARQRALRGQRGTLTVYLHTNAMADILLQLKGANESKLAGMLSTWDNQLFKAVHAHSTAGARAYRANARTISAEINGILDAMKEHK